MFDPRAGIFVAARKACFDEHFYGLWRKGRPSRQAARYFVNWNSIRRVTPKARPDLSNHPFYIGLQQVSLTDLLETAIAATLIWPSSQQRACLAPKRAN